MLIFDFLKPEQFQKTHQSKAVNAHDDFRGLYLFGELGSSGPQEINKKKSPTFFMPWSQRKEISNRHLGLGQRKVYKLKNK